jgi:hypothetical protein
LPGDTNRPFDTPGFEYAKKVFLRDQFEFRVLVLRRDAMPIIPAIAVDSREHQAISQRGDESYAGPSDCEVRTRVGVRGVRFGDGDKWHADAEFRRFVESHGCRAKLECAGNVFRRCDGPIRHCH